MSLPKYPDKYGHPSTFSAGDLVVRREVKDRDPFPAGVILSFQGRLYEKTIRKYRARAMAVPFGKVARLGGAGAGRVAIAGGFGIGAPAAVSMLEWLAAMGARRFVAVGFAGGLSERQSAGDLIVCSRALRDEGTSYHYLPPADYAEPDAGLTSQLSAALTRHGYAHENGPTWTTDAPFRETFAEVAHFEAQGILTVEMEAAALFSASTYLGTACAAAFAIGDGPRAGRWETDYDRKAMLAGFEKLVDAAVEVLAN